MVTLENSWSGRSGFDDECLQHTLALNQRRRVNIETIEVQEVECAALSFCHAQAARFFSRSVSAFSAFSRGGLTPRRHATILDGPPTCIGGTDGTSGEVSLARRAKLDMLPRRMPFEWHTSSVTPRPEPAR